MCNNNVYSNKLYLKTIINIEHSLQSCSPFFCARKAAMALPCIRCDNFGPLLCLLRADDMRSSSSIFRLARSFALFSFLRASLSCRSASRSACFLRRIFALASISFCRFASWRRLRFSSLARRRFSSDSDSAQDVGTPHVTVDPLEEMPAKESSSPELGENVTSAAIVCVSDATGTGRGGKRYQRRVASYA